VPVDLGLHGGRRKLIGVLQLDGLETGLGGMADALDQRILDVQVTEIGREAGHGVSRMLKTA